MGPVVAGGQSGVDRFRGRVFQAVKISERQFNIVFLGPLDNRGNGFVGENIGQRFHGLINYRSQAIGDRRKHD